MNEKILRILLLDRSRCVLGREHNIVWGVGEKVREEINVDEARRVWRSRERLDDARMQKSEERPDDAEILTPLNVTAIMNQKADEACGYAEISSENWRDYVQELKLELTCGEAPFIVNADGTGFLDQKLKVLHDYCQTADEWGQWVKVAYQSSYGYEISGEKLFLARKNLWQTFLETWQMKFPTEKISAELMSEMAEIISWNVFQMDGLTNTTPGRKLWVKVMDWRKREVIEFWKIGKNRGLV